MSKTAKRGDFGPRAVPSIEQCLFHRCERHEKVPQLDASEEQTGSECGACLAEEMLVGRAQLLLVLDGYGERLQYSCRLRDLLMKARNRLNLMEPGAGDFLDNIDQEQE